MLSTGCNLKLRISAQSSCTTTASPPKKDLPSREVMSDMESYCQKLFVTGCTRLYFPHFDDVHIIICGLLIDRDVFMRNILKARGLERGRRSTEATHGGRSSTRMSVNCDRQEITCFSTTDPKFRRVLQIGRSTRFVKISESVGKLCCLDAT